MSLINVSQVTQLKLYVQTLPYERIPAMPSLAELGCYLRVTENGFVEGFVKSADEIGQGEVVLCTGENGTRDGTVYRRTKPHGNLVKHTLVDITEYWEFFSKSVNFSVNYFDLLLNDLNVDLVMNFFKFDPKAFAENLCSVLYSVKTRANSDTASDSDREIYKEVMNVRDRFYMRLVYELIQGDVEPMHSSVRSIPTVEDTAKFIETCPWLSSDQIYDVVRALQTPEIGICHPVLFNYQIELPFLLVRCDKKYFLLTEKRIYDVSNLDENLPRFFVYVK